MSLKRKVLLLTCLLSALAVGGAQATTSAYPSCVGSGGGCVDRGCSIAGGSCGSLGAYECICIYVQ